MSPLDWLAVTGTNLYYDALLSLRTPLVRSSRGPLEGYEGCGGGIFVDAADRISADATLTEILSGPEFQRPMSSASMHQAMGVPARAMAELRKRGRLYNRTISQPVFQHYITRDMDGFEREFRDYAGQLADLE